MCSRQVWKWHSHRTVSFPVIGARSAIQHPQPYKWRFVLAHRDRSQHLIANISSCICEDNVERVSLKPVFSYPVVQLESLFDALNLPHREKEIEGVVTGLHHWPAQRVPLSGEDIGLWEELVELDCVIVDQNSSVSQYRIKLDRYLR